MDAMKLLSAAGIVPDYAAASGVRIGFAVPDQIARSTAHALAIARRLSERGADSFTVRVGWGSYGGTLERCAHVDLHPVPLEDMRWHIDAVLLSVDAGEECVSVELLQPSILVYL